MDGWVRCNGDGFVISVMNVIRGEERRGEGGMEELSTQNKDGSLIGKERRRYINSWKKGE